MFDRSVRCWLLVLILGSGSVVQAADEKPLADEMPRIPHVAAKDAVQTFSVQLGFSLEQVATEPLLSDPVDACFDEFGRMFVVEMHDYPFSHEPTKLNPKGGGKVGAGIVRMLEDTDGDGRMDQSWKFATGISWPLSVTPFKGGVFVLAPPKLWYFKDTDGDHIADIKDVVLDGFNRDNVQALANNLKWGLDHRIYCAGATNPSVLTREGREVLKLGRIDFSFDPQTIELRPRDRRRAVRAELRRLGSAVRVLEQQSHSARRFPVSVRLAEPVLHRAGDDSVDRERRRSRSCLSSQSGGTVAHGEDSSPRR